MQCIGDNRYSFPSSGGSNNIGIFGIRPLSNDIDAEFKAYTEPSCQYFTIKFDGENGMTVPDECKGNTERFFKVSYRHIPTH